LYTGPRYTFGILLTHTFGILLTHTFVMSIIIY
jgi:hypothetical protein